MVEFYSGQVNLICDYNKDLQQNIKNNKIKSKYNRFEILKRNDTIQVLRQ